MSRSCRRVHLMCNVQYSTFYRKDDREPPGGHMGSQRNDSLIQPIANQVAIQRGGAIRTMSQPGSNSAISVEHPAELSSVTQQTPGSLRMSAIAVKNGIVSSLWAGIFVVEPSAKTGIHHQANRTPWFTSLKERLVRGGATSGNIRPLLGWVTFCTYRAGCRIRRSTRPKEHSFRWVVVRSTQERIVVNLPDDFWTPIDPKPIERRRR
jgi:hypothetical protein